MSCSLGDPHMLVLVLPAVHPRVTVPCCPSAHSSGGSAPHHAKPKGDFLNTEMSLLRTRLCMVRQQCPWYIVRTGAINTENKGGFGMFSHLNFYWTFKIQKYHKAPFMTMAFFKRL